MGTNFYWMEERSDEESDISQHIGKRSAAGLYCYDCGTTLHRISTIDIHQSNSFNDLHRDWNDECPSCHQSAHSKDEQTNVKSACSFTWTLMKHKWEIQRSEEYLQPIIRDEYDRTYTASEFLEMLKGCPIEFQSPCWFS